MAGFEGFEKRLELHFSGDDPNNSTTPNLGLRLIDFSSIESVLHAVQCTVVSAVGNPHFDSYVLSESSLFVYPTKIVIKTCGTTQLLKSIRPLAALAAASSSLRLSHLKFTRGSFIFPAAQPYPHTSFDDEVRYIRSTLPPGKLAYQKASVMPSSDDDEPSRWHVFTASEHDPEEEDDDEHDRPGAVHPCCCCCNYLPAGGTDRYTVEICMTDLDRTIARSFFLNNDELDGKSKKYGGDVAGKEMTEAAGIHAINPSAMICDYGFDPCGYSMNGLHGSSYSTIHVTPEEGYSYASFEFVGGGKGQQEEEEEEVEVLSEVIKKVVRVFRPGRMSVATTAARGGGAWRDVMTRVPKELEEEGMMKYRSCAVDDFPGPGGSSVVFQTFTSCDDR